MNTALKVLGCLAVLCASGCQRSGQASGEGAEASHSGALSVAPRGGEPEKSGRRPAPAAGASGAGEGRAPKDDAEIEDDGRTYVYRNAEARPYLIRRAGVSYEVAGKHFVRAADGAGNEITPSAAVTAEVAGWVKRATELRLRSGRAAGREMPRGPRARPSGPQRAGAAKYDRQWRIESRD